MPLTACTLDQLTIRDAKAFRSVPLYAALRDVLLRDGFAFKIAPEGRGWQRVLFLNLTYWNAAEPNDVLECEEIDADVVCHVAWHHLARKALTDRPLSADVLFFGEAIASAFDLYLVGRLIGRVRSSDFLKTQVPAMAAVAEDAGLSPEAFEALMNEVSTDPDAAFESLRQLLFDAASGLVACAGVEEADALLASFAGHRFAPLLHHYELASWVLFARAYASRTPDPEVRAFDAELRAAADPVERLAARWIGRPN